MQIQELTATELTVEDLLNQVERFLAMPIPSTEARWEIYREELNRLYFHVTGIVVSCKPCQTDARKLSITNWLRNPKKVFQITPKTIETMAKSKVSEKYALANPDQIITFSTKNGFVSINKDNLTDELAELALKNEKVAHNIVTIKPAEEPKAADTQKGKTAAAKAE